MYQRPNVPPVFITCIIAGVSDGKLVRGATTGGDRGDMSPHFKI